VLGEDRGAVRRPDAGRVEEILDGEPGSGGGRRERRDEDAV
jgi:hypothetical protein